jgi:hypothetical protein
MAQEEEGAYTWSKEIKREGIKEQRGLSGAMPRDTKIPLRFWSF